MITRVIPSHRRLLISSLLVLICVGFGCAPSEFQKHLYQLKDDTKKEHRAADVQAALDPLFSDYRMLTNQLPIAVTSLPIFSDNPTNIEVCLTGESPNVLMLFIGGGFGHWGLIVARAGHEQEISQWHQDRMTPWEDGVYFFSEYK